MRPMFVTIHIRPWLLVTTLVLAFGLVGYGYETAKAPGRDQPTGPLTGQRIVVDPGHGGVDGGCSTNGLLEKDLNLAVGQALLPKLAAQGAHARLTRTSDEALVPWSDPGGSRHKRDLAARVQIAREYKASMYLALHANAGPPRLGGALTFYRKGDEESRRLAALIQEQLNKLMPGNQNGILPAKFVVLSGMTVPAVLVEMGFLTNPTDRAFLISPQAAEAIANGIATGVQAFAQGDVPVAPTLSPYPVYEGDDPDSVHVFPYPGCSYTITSLALAPGKSEGR